MPRLGNLISKMIFVSAVLATLETRADMLASAVGQSHIFASCQKDSETQKTNNTPSSSPLAAGSYSDLDAREFLSRVMQKRLAIARENDLKITGLIACLETPAKCRPDHRVMLSRILASTKKDLAHFQTVSLLRTVRNRTDNGNYQLIELYASRGSQLQSASFQRLPFEDRVKESGAILPLPFEHFGQSLISAIFDRKSFQSNVEIRDPVRARAEKQLVRDLEASKCELTMMSGEKCDGDFWREKGIYSRVSQGGSNFLELGNKINEIGKYYEALYLEYVGRNPLLMYMNEPSSGSTYEKEILRALQEMRTFSNSHIKQLEAGTAKINSKHWTEESVSSFIYDTPAVEQALLEAKKKNQLRASCEISRDVFYQLASINKFKAILPALAGAGCIIVTGAAGITPCGHALGYYYLASSVTGIAKSYTDLFNRISANLAYLGEENGSEKFTKLMEDKRAADLRLTIWLISFGTGKLGASLPGAVGQQIQGVITETIKRLAPNLEEGVRMTADRLLNDLVMRYVYSAHTQLLAGIFGDHASHVESNLETYASSIQYLRQDVEKRIRPRLSEYVKEYCRKTGQCE